MSRSQLYPFAEAMAIGFGLLRLAPDVFWRMTPKELSAAVGGATGRAFRDAPKENDLAALMRRFPDQPQRTDTQ